MPDAMCGAGAGALGGPTQHWLFLRQGLAARIVSCATILVRSAINCHSRSQETSNMVWRQTVFKGLRQARWAELHHFAPKPDL